MSNQRVIVYVDGFNLYYGMREQFGRALMWLDLHALGRRLLKSGQQLEAVKYCTARIASPPDKVRRQGLYLDALATLPHLQILYGKYQKKTVSASSKLVSATIHTAEEKMTDVQIASQMLLDAFTNRLDVALLVSNDSDLVPPIRIIRDHCPQVRVVCIFPRSRATSALKDVAHGYRHVDRSVLAQCQLPQTVTSPTGYEIVRPPEWT
ncbi:MAG: NYN domain-containing protein [Candidatus Sumerlaeia bacterium]|nr:NYN domain-containing protein [Candidatus Sumerlaeia bacterium]